MVKSFQPTRTAVFTVLKAGAERTRRVRADTAVTDGMAVKWPP
ncbi:hypothetical protein [Paenibacillus sedimenti]|nr:hypothetical protein [Paenibacillus sedimenti]